MFHFRRFAAPAAGWAVAALLILAPAAASADASVTREAVAERHGQGPDTPISFSADLALWSAVVFLLFLGLLWKLAWKPLTTGLDNRERRIRDDIAAAEVRVKAEQMLAAHAAKLDRVQDEVKGILAEARRDAETARQNILSDANAEAKAAKDRAVSEIQRVKDQALKELFDHFAGRVADATRQVLGDGLTLANQDQLINESLNQFAERPPVTRA